MHTEGAKHQEPNTSCVLALGWWCAPSPAAGHYTYLRVAVRGAHVFSERVVAAAVVEPFSTAVAVPLRNMQPATRMVVAVRLTDLVRQDEPGAGRRRAIGEGFLHAVPVVVLAGPGVHGVISAAAAAVAQLFGHLLHVVLRSRGPDVRAGRAAVRVRVP